MTNQDIEFIEAKTNPHIVLIAPHGFHKDDENTGLLARLIQKELDCNVIVNEVFRKPRLNRQNPKVYEEAILEHRILNLNWKPQAEMHTEYIRLIQSSIKDPENTYVFWIHGIEDVNLRNEINAMRAQGPIQCLIGYGQPDNHTMAVAKVNELIEALKGQLIYAAATRNDAHNYRAAHKNNMNQWFKTNGNGFPGVQSVQLEFGYQGLRDAVSINTSAKAIAEALRSFVGISSPRFPVPI